MDLDAMTKTQGLLVAGFGVTTIFGGGPELRAAWAGVTSAKAKPSRHMLKSFLRRDIFMTTRIHNKQSQTSTPMHNFHDFFQTFCKSLVMSELDKRLGGQFR